MDQVHVVRHKVLVEGRTQRAGARELGLSRTTVGKYVSQAAPVRKAEAGPRSRPVWDKVAVRDWVTVFAGHEKLTTALLDRLAHHATVLTTKGKSYRMRKRRTREEPS